MTDNLLQFIKDEKDIAKYKISLLKKGKDKSYKHRLISIERDFVEYPFEKISFETLDELKEAISLFKTDRTLFEKKFTKHSFKKTRLVSKNQRKVINQKIRFYNNLYKYLLDFEIKEVDLSLQNSDHSSSESANMAKRRARIQILIYCLSRFIYHKIKRIEASLDLESLSFQEYDLTRKALDDFFAGFKDKLFRHYNDGIIQTPLLIRETAGHNSFVPTIYPLVNLISKYPKDYRLERMLDKRKAFFIGKAPIKKRSVERGLGLITPMNRVGNEAINLLYLDLWTDNGISINQIMEKQFFNHNMGEAYSKAISTKPVWFFNKYIDNKFMLREACSLLELKDTALIDKIDFDDQSILDKINNISSGSISVCSESSKICVAATRSESEHIREALNWIDLLIKQIKNDYKSLFDPTTLSKKEREDRKSRVKKLKR
jgi:hypothetical protein